MNAPEPTPSRSPEERMLHLEERVAWLEKHVSAQDRAMLEQTEALDRMRAENRTLRDRFDSGGSAGTEEKESPPPHY